MSISCLLHHLFVEIVSRKYFTDSRSFKTLCLYCFYKDITDSETGSGGSMGTIAPPPEEGQKNISERK